MKIVTKAQYEELTDALLEAGYNVDTVYGAITSSGYSVDLGDKVYDGIYISRVIAIMHNRSASQGSTQPLKLKRK